jgi:hypothetical protein
LKKYYSGESQYISLNIKSLINKEDVHIWSKPKPVINDVILSNADIDYSRKIDAIFNTDNSGEIFFVQGIDATNIMIKALLIVIWLFFRRVLFWYRIS